jgi:hypothetical protein
MAILSNKDCVVKFLSRFDVSEDDVDLILLEVPELNPDASPDLPACKQAIYKGLSSILPLANISESGYSKSWNMEALKMWYDTLCTELNLPNMITPKIRNRSNLW